jgi:hypothetical protein
MVGPLLSPINQEAKMKTERKEARVIGLFRVHDPGRADYPKKRHAPLGAAMKENSFF